MRILTICPDTGIDVLGVKGAAVHVRAMVDAFADLGHSVELVAPRILKEGAAPAPTPATVTRVRVSDGTQATKHVLDGWLERRTTATSLAKDIRRIMYDAELETELWDRFGADPPDLLYVRASLLSTAGVEFCHRTGRPLVVEYNAPLAQESARYRASALVDLATAVERELLAAATLVVAVSEGVRAHVVGLGVDPERVVVLPNGVDPARFSPGVTTSAERDRLGIPDGPVLGFVGGLRPWHGVESLPAVLARVRCRHPDASLVIAGDGPLRPAIEAAAVALGVEESVVFLGPVDHLDMPAVIRTFSVALAPYPELPHDFYFSPLKVFEYLGCGVPVVASHLGQLAELLQDGAQARLVCPGDLDALASACIELLDDPDGAAAMAARGADDCRERFTWAGNARAVLSSIAVSA